MTVLSDSQFVEHTLSDGGATRSIHDGSVPTSGYAVASMRDSAGKRFRTRSYPASALSPAVAARGLARTQARTSSPQAHQGSWRPDADPTRVFLDTSEVDPHRLSAMTKAVTRGETAVYDVARGKDIYTAAYKSKARAS